MKGLIKCYDVRIEEKLEKLTLFNKFLALKDAPDIRPMGRLVIGGNSLP